MVRKAAITGKPVTARGRPIETIANRPQEDADPGRDERLAPAPVEEDGRGAGRDRVGSDRRELPVTHRRRDDPLDLLASRTRVEPSIGQRANHIGQAREFLQVRLARIDAQQDGALIGIRTDRRLDRGRRDEELSAHVERRAYVFERLLQSMRREAVGVKRTRQRDQERRRFTISFGLSLGHRRPQ